jgi:VWFA-related protein
MIFIACLAMSLAGSHVSGQAPGGPIAPSAGQNVQQPPPDLRVRVNLVNTPAVVRDANDELVLNLTANDFRILDNGTEQRIEGFDMGGAPLSVAIVVQTSSRIEALLPAVRRTGILFTQKILGENGDAAVIGFNDDVSTLVEFTSDQEAIERTLTQVALGTSGSRLYDAMSRGVAILRTRPDTRRRVMIVMAESVDTGSEERLGQVLRQAQFANVVIYTVGLSTTAAALRNPPTASPPISAAPPGTFGRPPIPGTPQTPSTEAQRTGNIDLGALVEWVMQHAGEIVHDRPLEVASAATGGLYQSTFRDSAISSALDQISGELHAQYMLSYRPTATGPAEYHEIKVEVVGRRGLKVRARPGYYLGTRG